MSEHKIKPAKFHLEISSFRIGDDASGSFQTQVKLYSTDQRRQFDLLHLRGYLHRPRCHSDLPHATARQWLIRHLGVSEAERGFEWRISGLTVFPQALLLIPQVTIEMLRGMAQLLEYYAAPNSEDCQDAVELYDALAHLTDTLQLVQYRDGKRNHIASMRYLEE